VLRAAKPRQLVLQLADLGTEDELAMCQHPIDAPAQVTGDALLLRL
jgi:hypothetical protein